MFSIRLGVPEMESRWTGLRDKAAAGKLGAVENQLYRKWGKAMPGSSAGWGSFGNRSAPRHIQLPRGVPVATMGIGPQGVLNAVHLAEKILAVPRR
jgi:hypothetical protein